MRAQHKFIVLLKNLRPIEWALATSLFFHAAVLSIKFHAPEQFDRLIQNTNLPLILVNIHLKADSNLKAHALAQSNLEGGGEELKGRMTSPLPNAAHTNNAQDAEDLNQEEVSLKALSAQQNKLLAQVRAQMAELNLTQPDPSNPERESKRRRMLEMLAEIESKIEISNQRPHKRYFSPSTKESVFAIYFDEMRRKIERHGTQNFPAIAGSKLYGTLTMMVTVNSLGQVLSVEIIQGSGRVELDKRAQAIVLSAGPFSAFNTTLKSKADQIALVSKFIFSSDGTLNTQLQPPDSMSP